MAKNWDEQIISECQGDRWLWFTDNWLTIATANLCIVYLDKSISLLQIEHTMHTQIIKPWKLYVVWVYKCIMDLQCLQRHWLQHLFCIASSILCTSWYVNEKTLGNKNLVVDIFLLFSSFYLQIICFRNLYSLCIWFSFASPLQPFWERLLGHSACKTAIGQKPKLLEADNACS